MKKNRVEVQVEWTPREFNREADAPANGDTSQFSPELKLRVEPQCPGPCCRNGTHCRKCARQAETEWEAETAQAARTSKVLGPVVRFSRTSCFVDAIGKRCIRSDCLALALSTCISSSFLSSSHHSILSSFCFLCLSHLPPNMGYLHVVLFSFFCSFLQFSRFPGLAGFTEFGNSSAL